jgi:hypothetical protein
MADYTAQIIDQPSTHNILDARQNAFRYIVGDILRTWDAEKWSTFDGSKWVFPGPINQKFQFIHVTGVPLPLDFDKLTLTEETPNLDPDPIVVEETPFIKRRRRRFRFNKTLLTPAQLLDLVTNQQLTLTWTEFKNSTQRKIIIDRDSTTTDTFTALVDGDL